jgi:Asp-tRNA(Asn)/Glu-tRNA(Gln) amidotransferase B subunit
MTEAEIEEKVKARIALEPVDPAKKGIFVGTMMKELGGNADGALVKAVIDRLIA